MKPILIVLPNEKKPDYIRFAAECAASAFGGDKGIFNSAWFGREFAKIAGYTTPLDGSLVKAMLLGRSDIQQLPGGAHWRLLPKT